MIVQIVQEPNWEGVVMGSIAVFFVFLTIFFSPRDEHKYGADRDE